MKYYLDQLHAGKFQRLINSLLVSHYGDEIRLMPAKGSDGGRDGETAPNNPFQPFIVDITPNMAIRLRRFQRLNPGRYMFQVKHHDTSIARPADVRSRVIGEFNEELRDNVLTRQNDERVNHFFLITNVTASETAINKVDAVRAGLGVDFLHADVWWGETVYTLLDMYPRIWLAFPELFPGKTVPIVSNLISGVESIHSRSMSMFLKAEYQKDRYVKFRQVDTEHELDKIFVDLEYDARKVDHQLQSAQAAEPSLDMLTTMASGRHGTSRLDMQMFLRRDIGKSITGILMPHGANPLGNLLKRVILEGGPGQGKSTVTQMVAQTYRREILQLNKPNDPSGNHPLKPRLPLRIELRHFAQFVAEDNSRSVEQHICHLIGSATGGRLPNVEALQSIIENSPLILIFDGLDEIGDDDLRALILQKIHECIWRFETELNCDLNVIIATRPPALAGHHERLQGYFRLPIAPLSQDKISEYTEKWLEVQIRNDREERDRIAKSFHRRRNETHVKVLSRNPMQLSILLHFIRLKGEAFPSNRAQLYKSYFEKVIDRDVEKSVGFSSDQREIIESLHKFLGYTIHASIEAKESDGTFRRTDLLKLVSKWLITRGESSVTAEQLFKAGEERLGLIIVTSGEGNDAQYGFEIQPVREYFAAAYFNDEIRGDVEPVFRELLLRPFWREVALFLGGLRKPKEKVNLILQAREVDAEDNYGWQQSGRSIILQLLLEGVLAQPPQVNQLALEFVIAALDPQLLPRQLEIDNYIQILPDLISQDLSIGGTIRKRIQQMLEGNLNNGDEYALARIYRVANQVLQPQSVDHIMKSANAAQGKSSLTRLIVWPALYNTPNLIPLIAFPTGKTARAARAWWRAVTFRPELESIEFPDVAHQYLIEEFAIDPRITIERSILRPPTSARAIWHLYFLWRFISSLSDLREEISSQVQEYVINLDPKKLDYGGLKAKTKHNIEALISALKQINTISMRNGSRLDEAVEQEYYDGVASLLNQIMTGGLDGWISARIGHTLLETIWGFRMYRPRQSQRNTVREKDLDELRRQVINAVRSYNATRRSGASVRDPKRGRSEEFLPTVVKLKSTSSQMTEIIDLVVQNIRGTLPGSLSWVSRVPLNTAFIQSLIDRFDDDLPLLLEWIGNKGNYARHGRQSLHVSKQQSINRIVTKSANPAVLRGALICLADSSFLSISGQENFLKMLEASSNSYIPVTIFPIMGEISENHLAILQSTAQHILAAPSKFGLRTIHAAARFLAERFPHQWPPLLELEERLGITVAI